MSEANFGTFGFWCKDTYKRLTESDHDKVVLSRQGVESAPKVGPKTMGGVPETVHVLRERVPERSKYQQQHPHRDERPFGCIVILSQEPHLLLFGGRGM